MQHSGTGLWALGSGFCLWSSLFSLPRIVGAALRSCNLFTPNDVKAQRCTVTHTTVHFLRCHGVQRLVTRIRLRLQRRQHLHEAMRLPGVPVSHKTETNVDGGLAARRGGCSQPNRSCAAFSEITDQLLVLFGGQVNQGAPTVFADRCPSACRKPAARAEARDATTC